MLKRLLNSNWLLNAFGWLIAAYIRFVHATARMRREPADTDAALRASHPEILAVWHGQFLLMPKIRPAGVAAKIMVARHLDAEIIGRALEHFGVGLIRGAGAGRRRRDRGGARALRLSLDALEQGTSVVMTADVPPGPARRAGAGIVALARLSGRPIIPAAMATNHYFTLDTWSRFTINLPFSRLGIVVGEPIHVPRDTDDAALEQARQAVESALNDVTHRAYELAGADPTHATPPTAGNPARPRLALGSYRLATRLARPIVPFLLKRRISKGKELAERLGERLGRAGRARPAGRLAWFHAASVGETNAILPLIHMLKARHPDLNILLTTFTVTSARIAAARLPKGAIHQFVPLDSPVFVRRFLDYWRPDVALFTESEIWPNLILDSHARGVPLILLNARMSPRSFVRWRRRPGLSKPLFSRFALILAQDDLLAHRFEQLGAAQVVTVGNLKIDAPAPPVNAGELAQFHAELGARPVFVAASTHPGEEEILAEAHRLMRGNIPDLLTIIIPRHPERGAEIAELMARLGIAAKRRSHSRFPDSGTEIYIADTLGELGLWYALAPVAFIGGSLVPHGGQNPVEAIKLGAVVLAGPHRQNFSESYSMLEAEGGCRTVHDAGDLAQVMSGLYGDAARLAAMQAGAERVLAKLGGALERTLGALEPYLAPGEAGAGGATATEARTGTDRGNWSVSRLKPPSWWYRSDIAPPTPMPHLLKALSLAYGRLTPMRFARAKPYRASVPVACIGNFTLGGAGKTPCALALAEMLRDKGHRPAFLSRGYGGRERGPHLVDPLRDEPARVGDEPLLLAQTAPTVIARNRPAGAQFIEARGADVIIMDDGLQNPSLVKDLSLVVIDASVGIGNGAVFPAGPLRAPLDFQLGLSDAIVLVETAGEARAESAPGFTHSLPVLRARLEPVGDPIWLGMRPVIAYCGIGRPDKFFATLAALGAQLAARHGFADHHAYSADDANRLLAEAETLGAMLVTTEKDWVRLPESGAQGQLKAASRTLPVRLEFSPEARAELSRLIAEKLLGESADAPA